MLKRKRAATIWLLKPKKCLTIYIEGFITSQNTEEPFDKFKQPSRCAKRVYNLPNIIYVVLYLLEVNYSQMYACLLSLGSIGFMPPWRVPYILWMRLQKKHKLKRKLNKLKYEEYRNTCVKISSLLHFSSILIFLLLFIHHPVYNEEITETTYIKY